MAKVPPRFNRIEPLQLNGTPYAEISRKAFCVHIHIDEENLETFSIDEARKLYEWLGRALPQADGRAEHE